MQPFTTITGAAVPLMRANIDTDVIIRIERLTGNADLGHYAFEALRYLPDGSPNPDCVFNQPRFRNAPILFAGRNFGCGSPRGGAVTALMAMGFRSVVAASFGDIFFANCFRNGLLPVVLAEEIIEKLAKLPGNVDFTVDLKQQTISGSPGETISFQVDPLQRESLLEGLDEIGLTLKSADEIGSWQLADRAQRPWVWQTGLVNT